MKLLNSLTQKKEQLPKTGSKPLRLFVCGPTVYDSIHIGNARVYVIFDALARYLKSQKQKVKYVQNITDIDDKIIAKAHEKKTTPEKLADEYATLYLKHMIKLNVTSVDSYARATKYIPQIKRQIEKLITGDFAYKIENDGWYFDLTKFPDYGKLSHRTVEQAEDGTSRIDSSVNKRNRGDFCLWKFSRIHEPSWKAKFGDGRPGWHIEDTAIGEAFFGSQYELHGGGKDLMFPHHEAEIAQAEAISGKKPYVKIWMHIGMLTMDGKKMSKSIGNLIPIEEFLTHHSRDAFRLFVLSAHYRANLDYSEIQITAAEHALHSIQEMLAKLKFRAQSKKQIEAKKKIDAIKASAKLTEEFKKALDDDFNTPKALAVIFEHIREINPHIWALSSRETKAFGNAITQCFAALGMILAPAKIPSNVTLLAKKREAFRNSQQFMHADALRVQLNELGYTIEDTPYGPLILKQKVSK